MSPKRLEDIGAREWALYIWIETRIVGDPHVLYVKTRDATPAEAEERYRQYRLWKRLKESEAAA